MASRYGLMGKIFSAAIARSASVMAAARVASPEVLARPLPRGAVSIHIRHGDKKREMSLVPTQRYLDAAEDLVTMHPFGYRNIGFLSTEDPGAVDELMAHNGTFRYLWWDVPRDNSNGPDQLMKLGLRRGELTMIWWLQLFIALEADAWVGTRGSNWNRLIDELRCVWVPKCQNVYHEVGDFARWEHQNVAWSAALGSMASWVEVGEAARGKEMKAWARQFDWDKIAKRWDAILK
jgi:hypothetical protein